MTALSRFLTVALAVFVPGAALAQADDHGDSRATATRLHYDIAESGSLESSGDVDYFRVDLQGSARVEFRSTMNLDTVGTLFDSEGEMVATADDINASAGNYNFRIKEDLDRGVYYLEVSGFENRTGNYQVLTRFDLEGDDHGDTFGSSSILPIGPRFAGSINHEDDVDWFRVDFPTAMFAEVRTESQNPVLTELYVPQDDGTLELYEAGAQPDVGQVWHGIWRGTSYFKVSGEVSAYNIRVEAEEASCECEDDPPEETSAIAGDTGLGVQFRTGS